MWRVTLQVKRQQWSDARAHPAEEKKKKTVKTEEWGGIQVLNSQWITSSAEDARNRILTHCLTHTLTAGRKEWRLCFKERLTHLDVSEGICLFQTVYRRTWVNTWRRNPSSPPPNPAPKASAGTTRFKQTLTKNGLYPAGDTGGTAPRGPAAGGSTGRPEEKMPRAFRFKPGIRFDCCCQEGGEEEKEEGEELHHCYSIFYSKSFFFFKVLSWILHPGLRISDDIKYLRGFGCIMLQWE